MRAGEDSEGVHKYYSYNITVIKTHDRVYCVNNGIKRRPVKRRIPNVPASLPRVWGVSFVCHVNILVCLVTMIAYVTLHIPTG
jgi:hypothetical protein